MISQSEMTVSIIACILIAIGTIACIIIDLFTCHTLDDEFEAFHDDAIKARNALGANKEEEEA